jgi:antitoxin VapB
MATAKVFWSGNSQAIRLPKDFRFPPDTEEVEIRREGERIVVTNNVDEFERVPDLRIENWAG